MDVGIIFTWFGKTSYHDNVIEAHEKLDSIQRGIDEANEKLDRLLCPFGDPPGADFTVLGQGCDAADQNCNNVTDECAEDKVPPNIALKVPPPKKPFKSTQAALDFLFENVVVSDDCAVNFLKGFQLLNGPDCCDCQFLVTARDERCIQEDPSERGMAEASRVFLLQVDSNPPVITCGFNTQQDPFHVSGGFDPCGGLPVPFPTENDPLHIDKTCFGSCLFNVQLWYQIEVRERRQAVFCLCAVQYIPVQLKLILPAVEQLDSLDFVR